VQDLDRKDIPIIEIYLACSEYFSEPDSSKRAKLITKIEDEFGLILKE
jgi:hypothetical protein